MHAAIRPLLLVAMLLVARGAARAEDPAPPKRLTPSQKAAVEALKAYEAEDRAAFERLARAPGTSAWQVADALRVQGHPEAARALAEASVDEDKPALLAYLEAEKALPRDDKALSAVDQANAAFGRNDFAGAIQALEGVTGRGVPGIGVLNGRALALGKLGRLEDARTTFVAMADASLALQWRAAAARALLNACDIASELRDVPVLRDLLQRRLDLAKNRSRGSEVIACTIDLGTATERAGDRAGAETLLREGIRMARDAGEKQFLANGLTNLGHLIQGFGRLDESEALLREGLALHESSGNAAYAERARMGLAEVRHLRGDFDGAVDLYRQAADAQAKAGDQRGMAGTLGLLTRIQLERGALDDALTSATRAKEVADEVASPPAIVDALLGLARVLRAKGRPVDAEARIQEALVLSQRVRYLSGERWARLELAKSALAINDIVSAMEHGEAALSAAEREGDSILRVAAQAVVGCAAGHAGDTRRAEALLRDVLAGLERRGSLGERARAVADQGFVLTLRGAYGQAIERTLAARDLFAQLGDEASVAQVTSNLGTLYMAAGDPDRALAVLEEAVKRIEGSPRPGDRAAALINLGLARQSLGEAQSARSALERGLALAVEAKNAVWEMAALDGLARVESAAGAFQASDRLFARAVDLARASGASQMRSKLQASWAMSLFRRGQAAEALTQAEAAVESAASCGSPDTEAEAHFIRGSALLMLDRSDEAVADLRAAAEGCASATRGLSVTSGDAAALWGRVQVAGLSAAVRGGDAALAFEFIERTRAGLLLEGLGGRDALREEAVPPDLRERETRASAAVVSARARLAQRSRAGQVQEARAARLALDAAVEAHQAVVERIQATSRTAAVAAFPRAATPAELRAVLGPGDAYVAYAATQDGVLAVVLTSESLRLVVLATHAEVDAQLGSLLGERLVELDSDALERARQVLLEPLGLSPAVKRLLISPQGGLALLPFQVLAGERTVAYTPSATALVLLGRGSPPPGQGVLALGDPDYGAAAVPAAAEVPGAVRGRTLAPLPGTRDEARAVGDLVLLGRDASESGLARSLGKSSRWHAVHLACHGLVDEARPLRSALALSSTPESDGYLSVLEVYRMRMPADLVVLSACDSGRGRVSDSEGVVGFTGAFLLAGADRVITSLWKVDDEATRALMTKFYELWLGRPAAGPGGSAPGAPVAAPLPTSEALRRAQAWVRAQPQWAHPRFWAAWQLWGRPD